jgi:hypothetical protein
MTAGVAFCKEPLGEEIEFLRRGRDKFWNMVYSNNI